MRLIVGTQHFELSEQMGNREDFLKLKSLLDGHHTRADIVRKIGLSGAAVDRIVGSFEAAGLLRRESEVEHIPAPDFAEQVGRSLDMWRRQIGFHRLFGMVETGDARLEVLQGLFIETYHVVSMASRHISVAIAHAESDAACAALSKYLAEEYDHAPMLFECCLGLGVDASRLSAAHPTVGSLSLVNMLAEIGRRDTLAYCAATSLFESAPGDFRNGSSAADNIRSAYGLDAAALSPALEHLRLDRESDHSSLFEEAIAHYETIPAPRVHNIVNMLHDLKHSYDTHHDEIVKYYGDISNYIPRPKVDYFSL